MLGTGISRFIKLKYIRDIVICEKNHVEQQGQEITSSDYVSRPFSFYFRKRLFAIAQRDSKHGFKLIQVQLPQDKDIRKSKR